jgi:TolA-binding protein
MELHEAPANYLFKLWPWFEANKIRLLWGGGIVVVAAGLVSFNVQRRSQREIDAGKKMTDLMMADPRSTTMDKQAAEFRKLAGDYAATAAGQRALLQGAAILFAAQKYPEAQDVFQQYLSQYSSSALAPQAALGLAACLDAQGKLDLAAAAYRRVIDSFADSGAAGYAKNRIAQISEQQGKVAEALSLYEDVARTHPGSPLGMEAGMRAMELRTSPVPAATNATPAAPFKLNP